MSYKKVSLMTGAFNSGSFSRNYLKNIAELYWLENNGEFYKLNYVNLCICNYEESQSSFLNGFYFIVKNKKYERYNKNTHFSLTVEELNAFINKLNFKLKLESELKEKITIIKRDKI